MAIVKRISEDDWRDLRLLRLSALADSPASFGSKLEEEQGFAESDWREWTTSAAVFIASQDGVPVGMVAALSGEASEERRLVALWVQPDHRGERIASDLVSHVAAWARDDGAERVVLWVTQGNAAARHLYGTHGFKRSGTVQSLPSHPDVAEEHMLLTLAST